MTESTRGLWVPLMMLDPGWNEVPRESSDFNLLSERVCTSLSINTWGLDWTHLKSLAVNEREREVTRLYRPIIICRERAGEQNRPRAREEQRSVNMFNLNYSVTQGTSYWTKTGSCGPIELINWYIDSDYLYNSSQSWRIDTQWQRKTGWNTNKSDYFIGK